MFEHKKSDFETVFNFLINEHKEDEVEDAQLTEEIRNLLTRGGVKDELKDTIVAMIMKKVQDHCERMSDNAWLKGFNDGREAK